MSKTIQYPFTESGNLRKVEWNIGCKSLFRKIPDNKAHTVCEVNMAIWGQANWRHNTESACKHIQVIGGHLWTQISVPPIRRQHQSIYWTWTKHCKDLQERKQLKVVNWDFCIFILIHLVIGLQRVFSSDWLSTVMWLSMWLLSGIHQCFSEARFGLCPVSTSLSVEGPTWVSNQTAGMTFFLNQLTSHMAFFSG